MSASTAIKLDAVQKTPQELHTERQLAVVNAIDPRLVKIFLGMYDPMEFPVAAAWVAAHYPLSPAGVPSIITNELPLPKCTPQHVIIPLLRHEDATPLESFARNQNTGLTEVKRCKPRDVFEEVYVCKPVYVRDYWTGRSDSFGGFGGDVKRSEFIGAVAMSTSPRPARCENGTPDVLLIKFV